MTNIDVLTGGPDRPGRGVVLRGKVKRAPVDASSPLFVYSVNYTGEYTYTVPASNWSPRGSTLPAAGADCIIVFDDDGDAWVPEWEGNFVPILGIEDAVHLEGILAAADLALTVNSITQVTIATGVVFVRNAAGFIVRLTPAATILSGIPAASASNFRLDQIVVSSAGVVSRLAGTQGTTVTLANRTGAATVPTGSRLLYDILVTSGGVLIANVRDRRPWAKGAYSRRLITGVRFYTGPDGNLYQVGGANSQGAATPGQALTQRVETQGGLIRCRFSAVGSTNGGAAGYYGANDDRLMIDGVAHAEARWYYHYGSQLTYRNWTWDLPDLAAGSRLFDIFASGIVGAGNWFYTDLSPCWLSIEEIPRPNLNNGVA